MNEDDWQPKPKAQMIIGQDLSALSIEDLQQRLTALDEEKKRVASAINAKKQQADLAANLFKS